MLWRYKENLSFYKLPSDPRSVLDEWAVIWVEGMSTVRHRCITHSSPGALSQLTASSLYHHHLLFLLHSFPPTHGVLSNLYTSNHLWGWAALLSCTDTLMFLLFERTHPQDVIAISGSLTSPIQRDLLFSFAQMTHFWCYHWSFWIVFIFSKFQPHSSQNKLF